MLDKAIVKKNTEARSKLKDIFGRLEYTVYGPIEAGNNSQKLKNEIGQLLYSLYRSNKLSKTIRNSLMKTII